jgi:hypothetical protein
MSAGATAPPESASQLQSMFANDVSSWTMSEPPQPVGSGPNSMFSDGNPPWMSSEYRFVLLLAVDNNITFSFL